MEDFSLSMCIIVATSCLRGRCVCVSVCLQCVAVCCSVLQCAVVYVWHVCDVTFAMSCVCVL